MQRYENQMKIVLLRDYFYRYFTLRPDESQGNPSILTEIYSSISDNDRKKLFMKLLMVSIGAYCR